MDTSVISRWSAAIKFGINWLKEYQISQNEDDFQDFYSNIYTSLDELSSFLSCKKPSPDFMNSVTALTELVEVSCRILVSNISLLEDLEFKLRSILRQIETTKQALAKQWVKCIRYYKSQISYGGKKIKGFFERRYLYYAEDSMHDITFKIIYNPPYFHHPAQRPNEVLKKYIESVHTDDYIIKECSITYAYVKDKIDQTKYPLYRYLCSFDIEDTNEIQKLLNVGGMLEKSKWFGDLLELIKKTFILHQKDVSLKVKNQLKEWFEKMTNSLEKSLQTVNKIAIKHKDSKYNESISFYKAKIANELTILYEEIKCLLLKILLPSAKNDESKIIYYNLIWDYHLLKLKILKNEKYENEVNEAEINFK